MAPIEGRIVGLEVETATVVDESVRVSLEEETQSSRPSGTSAIPHFCSTASAACLSASDQSLPSTVASPPPSSPVSVAISYQYIVFRLVKAFAPGHDSTPFRAVVKAICSQRNSENCSTTATLPIGMH